MSVKKQFRQLFFPTPLFSNDLLMPQFCQNEALATHMTMMT